jgi:hypothetical protein
MMARKKHTVEQTVGKLREAEVPLVLLCHKLFAALDRGWMIWVQQERWSPNLGQFW